MKNTVQSFLKARYQELKDTDDNFSYRAFSKEAGFGSPNYLKLVMDGKRFMSVDAIDKFAKGLRLSENETTYFRKLVISERIERDPEVAFILQHVANEPDIHDGSR